ncbi:hypothetical protein AKJ16_DCAP03602 [Drosera capensis]
MSSESPYERVKGGRLTFKGGTLASRSKTITKKSKKPKSSDPDKDQNPNNLNDEETNNTAASNSNTGADSGGAGGGEVIYTIDAAKKMKYDDLFPVEAKRFGYDPLAKTKSVEEALDDRVKKKADRCLLGQSHFCAQAAIKSSERFRMCLSKKTA